MEFYHLFIILAVALCILYLAELYSKKVFKEAKERDKKEKSRVEEETYKANEDETLAKLKSIKENLLIDSCQDAIIGKNKITTVTFKTKITDDSKDYFFLFNMHLSENKEYLYVQGHSVFISNGLSMDVSENNNFLIDTNIGTFVIITTISDLFGMNIPYAKEEQKEEYIVFLFDKWKKELLSKES